MVGCSAPRLELEKSRSAFWKCISRAYWTPGATGEEPSVDSEEEAKERQEGHDEAVVTDTLSAHSVEWLDLYEWKVARWIKGG